METFSHNCIKCGRPYSDSEVDAYLCAPCVQERQTVAIQVDQKFRSTVGQQPSGELQRYNELVNARGGKFPNFNELIKP